MLTPEQLILIRVTESFPSITWSRSGSATVNIFGVAEFSTPFSGVWDGEYGEITCDDPRRIIWDRPLGKYGRIPLEEAFVNLSETTADTAWSAVNCSPLTGGNQGTTLRCSRLDETFKAKTAAVNVMMFDGVPPVDFPDSLPVPEGLSRPWYGERGLFTKVFGRDALLRRPAVNNDDRHFLIAYTGPRLSESEEDALYVLIWFLSGREVEVVCNIIYTESGDIAGRTLFARKSISEYRPKKPLEILDARVLQALRNQFENLVSTMHHLLSVEQFEIDVAIDYAARTYEKRIDWELRDLTSAVNALVEANAGRDGTTEALAASQFETLYEELSAIIHERCKGAPRAANHLVTRLKTINSTTTSDRQKSFWQRVGFEPRFEKNALKTRHLMVHRGYLYRNPDRSATNLMLQQADELRALVNVSILRLLKYEGEFNDYSTSNRRLIKEYIEEHSLSD